jgi:hypothetical protein
MVFQKGKTYHISFSYKIENAGDGKTKFYSLLRSRNGGDTYGDFWLWNRYTGAEGTIQRLFKVDRNNCFLIIGVRNRGAIRIKNLIIREVSSRSAPGQDVAVKNLPGEVVRVRDEMVRDRDKSKTSELLRQMRQQTLTVLRFIGFL